MVFFYKIVFIKSFQYKWTNLCGLVISITNKFKNQIRLLDSYWSLNTWSLHLNLWECWFSLSYGLSITSIIISLYLLENKLLSSEENSSLIEHYYGSCYDSLSGLYPRVTLKGSSDKGKGGGRIVNVGSLLKWVWLLHQITCDGNGCFLTHVIQSCKIL